MKIYCLGPQNTFSDLMARKLELNAEICYEQSFTAVADRVATEPEAIGLIVLENSNSSTLHESIDALYKNKLNIVAECMLDVKMHLIAREDAEIADVKKVYSKQVALTQCSRFISDHDLEAIATESTSAGLEHVKNSKDSAIIAGSQAVSGGLKILAADIANLHPNITRFVLISQKKENLFGLSPNKLTTILTLPHKVGSLANLLTEIAQVGGNLTKIESRPIPATEWEYEFWLDVEFSPERKEELLQVLDTHANEYRLLGIYAKGRRYDS